MIPSIPAVKAKAPCSTAANTTRLTIPKVRTPVALELMTTNFWWGSMKPRTMVLIVVSRRRIDRRIIFSGVASWQDRLESGAVYNRCRFSCPRKNWPKCANTIRSQGENNENLQIGDARSIYADVHDCGDCSCSAYFDFQVQDHPGAGSADYNGWRD